ncbi:MAG: hypothetical protein NT096_08110 [Proteobacteria bacterium]|nr:hypothetical protein [Pseudomonadota bacterium]
MNKKAEMKQASFIHTEDGDDLIVSFAITGDDPIDPAGVKSLTLVRTPKFESLLSDDERGVTVSYDDFPDDEYDLLTGIVLENQCFSIRTQNHEYTLNMQHVDNEESAGC